MKKIEVIKTYYVCDNEDKKRFKKWLIDHNTTAEALAKTIGISDAYISAIFKGKRNITPSIVEMFKKVGFDLKVE